MKYDKRFFTTLFGVFVVALLVVSMAGCTSSPTATTSSPTLAASTAAQASPTVTKQPTPTATRAATATQTPAATATPAPQQQQATPTPSSASYTGPFVASRNSNVYHYPWCYHVNAILPKNLISFPTAAAAQTAGYRPCKDCNPPT
jgi:hypothetical protein